MAAAMTIKNGTREPKPPPPPGAGAGGSANNVAKENNVIGGHPLPNPGKTSAGGHRSGTMLAWSAVVSLRVFWVKPQILPRF